MRRPILLQNICKEKEWGGNTITKMFGITSPFEKTGEVWTASAHQNGETPIIIGNDSQTRILSQYYKEDKQRKIFGPNCKRYEEFPLLAKWIDANDNLSVQVHPDDEYAIKMHNSYGKTEAWFIVSAKKGAQIVYGLKKGTTKAAFIDAVEQNRIKDVLNFIPVKEGGIYYIPSGMVHALLDGVVVYEIQQSSDITYRVYDWDRNDPNRPLEIEKALNVINFEKNDEYIQRKPLEIFESLITLYFNFRVYNGVGTSTSKLVVYNNSFKLFSVLYGSIIIKDVYGIYELAQVKAGNSFVLPCADSWLSFVGYPISGETIILESTVN